MASWNFPGEVITEILSWVPVKSLMKFKCVSKTWFHLISTDPHFMKLHFSRSIHVSDLNRLKSNPGILASRLVQVPNTQFYYAEDYAEEECNELLTWFAIPFSNPPQSSFKVVNVCYGLVCLTDYNQESNAYIWNPLTRDHIALPSFPIPSRFHDWIREDASRYRGSYSTFGFGFDSTSDEYKVVRLVSIPFFEQIDHQCHTHASVYTLGTGSSWRTLPQFVPYSFSHFHSATALVNDALHWFGYNMDHSEEWVSPNILIAFKMNDEIFEEIPQPHGLSYDYPYDICVGELCGFLCIFHALKRTYLEIWMMLEYGVADSWRRLCRIGQSEVPGKYDFLKPLGVADNGEIIISKTPWDWISYDPNTNSVRDLRSFDCQVFHAHTFDGSLLSPTIINRASTTSGMIE